MVVGNFMITFAFWAVMSLAVRIISYTSIISTLDTLGLCRFPSAPLFVFQFFLQGTALGAMVLVLEAPSAATFVIGFAALVFCFVVPCLLVYKIKESVPSKAYYATDEEVVDRSWLRLLIGPGEWVSRNGNEHWALRYASALRPFSQKWAAYNFVEMASNLAIAGVQATDAENLIGCGHKKLMSALIFAFLLVVELKIRPRCKSRDIYLSVCMLGLQTAAMSAMAVAYYHEDTSHPGLHWSAIFLRAAVGMILLKIAMDIISEIYIFFTRRRARLQAEAFAKTTVCLEGYACDEFLNRSAFFKSDSSQHEGSVQGCDQAGLDILLQEVPAPTTATTAHTAGTQDDAGSLGSNTPISSPAVGLLLEGSESGGRSLVGSSMLPPRTLSGSGVGYKDRARTGRVGTLPPLRRPPARSFASEPAASEMSKSDGVPAAIVQL